MNSNGIKWDQMQPDGSFISYKESLKAFEPSEGEFQKLKNEIESILGRPTTATFDDTLLYMLTLARHRVYEYENTFTSSDKAEDIKKLEGALKRLGKLINQDGGIHEMTRFDLWRNVREEHPDIERDLLWDTGVCVEAMLEACAITKEKIKGQRRPFTDNDMRAALAEELARLLDQLGEVATKTRGGKYEKMLHACIAATDFKYKNKRYSLPKPENLGPVMDAAIDCYSMKEPFVFLGST
tara:strand:- start:279 stop:998 length:720 start_codon:yes stop_codon:yes gene_type:complete